MNKFSKFIFTIFCMLAIPYIVRAQASIGTKHSLEEPVAIAMISIAVLLVFAIYFLSKAVFKAHDHSKRKNKNITAVVVTGMLFSFPAFAADTQTAVASTPSLIGGLSQTAFYFLATVIALEVIIVLYLYKTFNSFLKKAIDKEGATAAARKKRFSWLERLNNTKSVDSASEAAVNLGHDYDGIGELDNPTPPWWQWGFVISVIFAVVYMYTHHVSKTSPLQIEELAIANEKAEKQIAQFLATSSNNIDENNVVLLTESNDLLEGKEIFTAACAACHGVDGGGIVGPNLTDKYWLHGGRINDIFRTIKYGVPEKGMKSWKDDYSPKQIARIASYVHSLQGTTPADPKPAEGELHEEEVTDAAARPNAEE